jgi:CarD family transcriptional regulator
VVQHSTETEAVKEIESQLAKSPRRGVKAEGSAEGEGEAEGDVDEADEAEGDGTTVADEAA